MNADLRVTEPDRSVGTMLQQDSSECLAIDITLEPRRVLLTLLFTDIVDSSKIAERLGDSAWHALLGRHRDIVREQLARFGGREVDSSGDGFFATFDAPAHAIRCVDRIRASLQTISLSIRAGVHVGECLSQGGDVSGLTVHVAARIAARAEPGEVLVSNTAKDLVSSSEFGFSNGAWHVLKGLSGTRRLFSLSRVECGSAIVHATAATDVARHAPHAQTPALVGAGSSTER